MRVRGIMASGYCCLTAPSSSELQSTQHSKVFCVPPNTSPHEDIGPWWAPRRASRPRLFLHQSTSLYGSLRGGPGVLSSPDRPRTSCMASPHGPVILRINGLLQLLSHEDNSGRLAFVRRLFLHHSTIFIQKLVLTMAQDSPVWPLSPWEPRN